MELSCNVDMACKVGIEAAVVFRYVEDGIKRNDDLYRRFGVEPCDFIYMDGRLWTDGRLSSIALSLKCLSEEKICKALIKLADKGYLDEKILSNGKLCYTIKEKV